MPTNNTTSGGTKRKPRQMFDTKIKREYDRPLEYTPDKYLTPDKELPTIGYDPQMDINAYGSGVLLAGLQTIATSILRLMYAVPGNFPDYPDLGIDIRKYLFSFDDEFTAAKLRQEVIMQQPLMGVYINDNAKFTVIKTTYNNQPVVVVQLESSVRKSNGLDDEMLMNIGITFEDFRKLTSDISFAYNGKTAHFSVDKGLYTV